MRLLNLLAIAPVDAPQNTEPSYPAANFGLLKGLIYDWLTGNGLSSNLASFLTTILVGVGTIILGWFLVKIIRAILRRVLLRKRNQSVVLTFSLSVITAVLYIIYLFVVLSVFGVDTGALTAIMAASSIAIGFALQGSLGNVASGLVILIVKPFKVGDLVNIDGLDGVVKEINLATTLIDTPDNHCVTLPNTLVATNRIINYHRNELRRIDLTFNIAHGHSSEFIKELLQKIGEEHPDVSRKMPVTAAVGSITSSYATYFFRVWVNSKEFLKLRFEILELTMNTFKKNNVHFEVEKFIVNTGISEPGDMNLDKAISKTKRSSQTTKAQDALAIKAVAATKTKTK